MSSVIIRIIDSQVWVVLVYDLMIAKSYELYQNMIYRLLILMSSVIIWIIDS